MSCPDGVTAIRANIGHWPPLCFLHCSEEQVSIGVCDKVLRHTDPLTGMVKASSLALPCQRLSCLQEYYKAVSGAFAVLPAFGSDAYYTRKASSSVATAIICGRMLIHCGCISASYIAFCALCASIRALSQRWTHVSCPDLTQPDLDLNVCRYPTAG